MLSCCCATGQLAVLHLLHRSTRVHVLPIWSTSSHLMQVVQLDSAAAQAGAGPDTEPASVVDVIELMAAVLEDSPSNRLTMLQTSGETLPSF